MKIVMIIILLQSENSTYLRRKSILFCICMTRDWTPSKKSLPPGSSYRKLQDYKSVYRNKLLVRNFVTTFLWQRAVLCCRELKATTSPQHEYTQGAVQPRCEFRFLCPLSGWGALFPRSSNTLTTQTKLQGILLVSSECWEEAQRHLWGAGRSCWLHRKRKGGL